MALLVLLQRLEPFGFASHPRGDPLITNDVLYQLSYTGIVLIKGPTMALLEPQPIAYLTGFTLELRADPRITKDFLYRMSY